MYIEELGDREKEKRKTIIGLFYLNSDFLAVAFLLFLKQILEHTFIKLSKPYESFEVHFEKLEMNKVLNM